MIGSSKRMKRWLGPLLLVLAFMSPLALANGHPPVRLALVNIADDILRPLLPGFSEQTGLAAEIVYMGNDPYSVAAAGKVDLVISHYGHPGVEPFVLGGRGRWPHTVFANQMALFGPPDDPAGIRGMTDAAQAMARIAAAGAPYVANASHGARYLEKTLLPENEDQTSRSWYLDRNVAGRAAMQLASEKNAYVLWGYAPYLRYKRRNATTLEPLVVGDPLFQRIMVSVVVKQGAEQAAAEKNAEAFERYLLSPLVQSRVRAFRYPGMQSPMWWPAGRHNGQEE
jgi:tungstate transport system substrate-binding protein